MKSNYLFQAVSDSMLVELKACFMEAYDDNQDGKIDIREVCTSYSYKNPNKLTVQLLQKQKSRKNLLKTAKIEK